MFNSKRTLFLPNANADSAHLALIQLIAALILTRRVYGGRELPTFETANILDDTNGLRCTVSVQNYGKRECVSEISFANVDGVIDGTHVLELTVRDWVFGIDDKTYESNLKTLVRLYDDARASYYSQLNNPNNSKGIAFSPSLTNEQYYILAQSRVSASFNRMPLFDGTSTEPTFGNGCLALESFLKELRLSKAEKDSKTKSTDPLIDFLNTATWRNN